jgi:hypothetical protein
VISAPTVREMNTGANVAALPRYSGNAGVRVSTFGAGSASSASNSIASNVGVAAAGAGSFLMGWGGIMLVLLALIVLFAVYYQTIGYYIQIGWEKLKWSHDRGERVEIDVPGPISAQLQPASGPSGQGAGSSISSDISSVIGNLESDVKTALGDIGLGAGAKQVFNVSRNLYTFGDAEPLCRAFGAELATYDQVKEAYEKGADWCNYGWVKGQLAVYPTQQSTYDKLQHGPESERMSCGLPGVNGGYFPNEDQRFGVNCYGVRPAESALDEREQMQAKSNTAFDREVNHFKAQLDSIAVNPWSAQQWSA